MISDAKSKATLAASAASRVIAGIGSILLLAWYLELRDYGLLVMVLAAAQIAGVITNFGFQLQLLRDSAEKPEEAGALLSASIRVKNILVLALAALLATGLWAVDSDLLNNPWTIACIYLSATLNSYNELCSHTLKGLQRFNSECINAIGGNALYLFSIVIAALISGELAAVAVALAMARALQLLASLFVVSRYVSLANLIYAPFHEIIAFCRRSFSIGLDSTLTAISAQVDVLLVSAIFGLETVGAYQIVSRLAGFALMPAQILISAFLPRLVKHQGGPEGARLRRQISLEYFAMGTVFGFGFLLLKLIYPYVFASGYQLGWPLWLGFATLIFTKYIVSLTGVFLVVRQLYRVRIVAQLANSAIIIGGFSLLLPTLSIYGAPWILIVAYIVTGIIYTLGMRMVRKVH